MYLYRTRGAGRNRIDPFTLCKRVPPALEHATPLKKFSVENRIRTDTLWLEARHAKPLTPFPLKNVCVVGNDPTICNL